MASYDRRSRRQRESADPIARYLGELQAGVMRVLWKLEEATVREVVEALNEKRESPLAYTTVLTLVTRLWSRGLLAREPEGRGFRYRALRSRDELLATLSDELIDQLLDDFGEIAVARLDARLGSLDQERKKKLREKRKQ
jgi:predicted transcriptional regulator